MDEDALGHPPVPLTEYVIVAVPAPTPVTKPLASTVATAALLEDQVPPDVTGVAEPKLIPICGRTGLSKYVPVVPLQATKRYPVFILPAGKPTYPTSSDTL